MRRLRRLALGREGAKPIEYAVAVALIVCVALFVYFSLGGSLNAIVNKVGWGSENSSVKGK